MKNPGGTRSASPPLEMRAASEAEHEFHLWPEHSRTVIEHIIHSYQWPNIVTNRFLLWDYNSPWKRTIVYREGTVHHFPVHHEDVVEQTVDYHVPLVACAKLLQFNGSIIINRTRGELGVCCKDESMNCIILNLAHDIILEHKTVDEARRKQAELTMARRFNWPVDYAEALHFVSSSREGDYRTQNAGDPDKSLIKKGLAEVGHDVVQQTQRVLGS